jgi:hypothetical protein
MAVLVHKLWVLYFLGWQLVASRLLKLRRVWEGLVKLVRKGKGGVFVRQVEKGRLHWQQLICLSDLRCRLVNNNGVKIKTPVSYRC